MCCSVHIHIRYTPTWPSQGTYREQKVNKPGTKEQKVNTIYLKLPARQNLSYKALNLLHKFTDELSVSVEYMKKIAKISRKVKTLERMHKTEKQIT